MGVKPTELTNLGILINTKRHHVEMTRKPRCHGHVWWRRVLGSPDSGSIYRKPGQNHWLFDHGGSVFHASVSPIDEWSHVRSRIATICLWIGELQVGLVTSKNMQFMWYHIRPIREVIVMLKFLVLGSPMMRPLIGISYMVLECTTHLQIVNMSQGC